MIKHTIPFQMYSFPRTRCFMYSLPRPPPHALSRFTVLGHDEPDRTGQGTGVAQLVH